MIGSSALEPLNMRHAEWCPLAEQPFASVRRERTRACDCGNQLAQDAYDLGCQDARVVADQRPRIVVLCGSTRFKRQFFQAQFEESLQGRIVLTMGWAFPEVDRLVEPSAAEKRRLDELHLRKIDLADEVLLIAPDGYIGSSTSSEIAYAIRLGKPIREWQPQADWPALELALELRA